jgi:hypothetical protein
MAFLLASAVSCLSKCMTCSPLLNKPVLPLPLRTRGRFVRGKVIFCTRADGVGLRRITAA